MILAEAEALADEGLVVTGVSRSNIDNRVTLGLLEEPTAEDEAALLARFPGIQIARQALARPQDDRSNSAGQWKGGLTIWRADGARCSTGFGFRKSDGTRYISTAGHCHAGGAVPWGTGSQWDHNWNSNYPLVANTLYSGSSADAAMIQPSFNRLVPNIVIVNSNSPSDPNALGASVVGKMTAMEGVDVCLAGSNQGVADCAPVAPGIHSVPVDGDGNGTADYTLHNQRAAHLISAPGDSGGAVFGHLSSPGPGILDVDAAGIFAVTIGTLGFFTTISSVEAALPGVTVITDTGNYFPLRPRHVTGKCIEPSGQSSANFVMLVQDACNSSSAQWIKVRPRYGMYQLGFLHSGRCFTAPAMHVAASIFQLDCVAPLVGEQLFWFASAPIPAEFQIVSWHSSQCGDIEGSSPSNNARLLQYHCSPAALQANQRFRMW